MRMVYLDNNATTRPAPEAVTAMTTALTEVFGNPSSSHVAGQRAAFLVAEARQELANCLGAKSAEIVFTSGGTESDSLAIRGVLGGLPHKRHMIISAIEHEAVAHLADELETEGVEVTRLGVDRDGRLDLDELRSAIRQDTAIVSIMLANNETGILFPLQEIGRICRDKEVVLHTDAVQAVGKIRIDLRQLPVDLLSLSAHKFHGPKGVGALFVRQGLKLRQQIVGGNQESGRRSGTENVPGIVALGAIAKLIGRTLDDVEPHVQALRDDMEERLLERIPSAEVIGADSPRLPNTSYLCVAGTAAEQVLIGLSEEGICASGGSACHSGALEMSSVLRAMGIDMRLGAGAIRLSLSRYTTAEEIDLVVQVLPRVVEKLQCRAEVSS